MSFEEITQVAPWLDFAIDCGVNLDADQISRPRLWKTHQRLSAVNGGGKYIVTIRDPASVAASYYHFYASKGQTSGLNLDEWTLEWSEPRGSPLVWCDPIWEYIVDSYARRGDTNVLIVCFEVYPATLRIC